MLPAFRKTGIELVNAMAAVPDDNGRQDNHEDDGGKECNDRVILPPLLELLVILRLQVDDTSCVIPFVEEFWALFLNPKHEMLRRVRICRGEVSENAADPRNIMRFGVLYNATYIVTVHNHISGNPSPTKFDSIIAARLKTAAEAVRMTLRDHIILAEERYFSFKENKKL